MKFLGNNVLSFDDIVRIKQVEDVLEKYWNDHRMDRTIEYLVIECFETPFDFFQQFGSYWENQGWSRIGHQLEDLFRRLYEFLSTETSYNISVIEGLMKLDYLENQKYKPRKPWWIHEMTKEERSSIYQSLLQQPSIAGEAYEGLNLNEKELYKHTLLEAIRSKDGQDQYVLAYFEPATGQSTVFAFDRQLVNL